MGLELEVALQAVPALGDNVTFDVTLYGDAVFGFATADKPWLIFGATGDDIRYTFTGLVGTADSTGDRFTVALPQVDPGLYDVTISAVRADGTKTLVNIRNDLETTGDVSTGDMGTLLEGSALDASLLAAAYGTSSGDTKFDARVDFNRDGQVDAADLALLKGNYLEFSPRLLNPLSAPTGLDLLPASDSGRSDTDNFTSVATPTISLEADSGATVHLLLDGVVTADAVAASRVEFTVGPLSDGPHVFTATAEGGDGRVSGESEPVVVLIDTSPPSLPLEAPLAGGRYTATARLIGSATDQGSGVDVVRYAVDGGGASLLALNAQGGFDLPLAAGPLATGPHQLSVDALDVAGNSTQVTADFDVASDFTVGPDGTGGWGSVVGDSAQLEEGDSFLVQVALPVELAGASTRTLSFEVVANFDPTDQAAVTDDRFLVYLVSTAESGQTLLDRGQPGTAIFSLGEGGAEFLPGLVGYDGSVVEIDLSSLSDLTTGDLVFQLLGETRTPAAW